MNAPLKSIDFRFLMSEITTLTVRIGSGLMRELEARAQRVYFTVDELVTQMISASLFRSSPEYHDPNSERARHFRMVEEGLGEIARGETVSLEDFEKSMDQLLGAEGSPDLPSKR